jgi:YHS domain-containing protein
MFAFLGRILELLMAFAMIRAILQTALRIFRGSGEPRDSARSSRPEPTPGNAADGSSATTLLHQDPVCGTYVAAGSSLRKICNGKVVHFCSEKCRDRYVA